MKRIIAGALVLVALTGCQKQDKSADDGFGAGATPPAATDTTMGDTSRVQAVPDSTTRPDSSNRPQ